MTIILSNIVSFDLPQFGLLQYCTYCTASSVLFENGKYLREFAAKFENILVQIVSGFQVGFLLDEKLETRNLVTLSL